MAGPRGLNAIAARMVSETAISIGINGPGLNGKLRQTSTFDIAVPNIPAGRKVTTAWYNVVGNFKELPLFESIKVEPLANANDTNSVRLTFLANEGPCHVVIQIFAEGE
jgi:hypothetical protein